MTSPHFMVHILYYSVYTQSFKINFNCFTKLFNRHTTLDLLQNVKNLGMLINLTNTKLDNKYYSPGDITSQGIDYKRIKVEGHVVPSKDCLLR